MCTRVSAARGRSLTPPVGGRGSGGGERPLPPGRPTPAGHQGAPLAGWEHRRAAEARPGRGHGPLRVDQRPPGDQRDAGDPAARGARLRRRGEGRAEADPTRGPSCWARPGSPWGPGLPASASRPAVHGGRRRSPARGTGGLGGAGGWPEPGTVQFRLCRERATGTPSPPSCWTGDGFVLG